ncbi:hypothetical protein PHLCEN_2v6354, partial [Hermanssonia centrifuga]
YPVQTPPNKRINLHEPLSSPNNIDVVHAIKMGGVNERLITRHQLLVVTETVEFVSIPRRSFKDIVAPFQPELRQFSLDTSPRSHAFLQIRIASTDVIGIGTFKTAHPGKLTLVLKLEEPSSACGGSVSGYSIEKDLDDIPSSFCGAEDLPVVVKRLYHQVGRVTRGRIDMDEFTKGCYTPADELQKLSIEANTIYWAIALHGLSHDFIHRKLHSLPADQQIQIPFTRFVNAGLALAHGALPSKPLPSSATTTLRAVYLVEEPIVGRDGEAEDFVKLIHNSSAVPLISEKDKQWYDLALFAACHQHIQYWKTGGIAYVSDYQGSVLKLLVVDSNGNSNS